MNSSFEKAKTVGTQDKLIEGSRLRADTFCRADISRTEPSLDPDAPNKDGYNVRSQSMPVSYFVSMDAKCTCPGYTYHDTCKHLWAVIKFLEGTLPKVPVPMPTINGPRKGKRAPRESKNPFDDIKPYSTRNGKIITKPTEAPKVKEAKAKDLDQILEPPTPQNSPKKLKRLRRKLN